MEIGELECQLPKDVRSGSQCGGLNGRGTKRERKDCLLFSIHFSL